MTELRPAAFFDRDGTLIVEADYLDDPNEVVLIPGAAEGIRAVRDAGWLALIVTNQSGIARGLYTEADYAAVTRRLEQLLATDGASVDAILHCPHHPHFTGPCDCRKPAPGMLLQASDAYGIDLGRSIVVGDKLSDLGAAAAVGARPVLVRTGYGSATEESGNLPPGTLVVDSVADVASRMLSKRPFAR